MKKTLLVSVLVCLPVFLLAQTTATFTLGGTQTFVSPAGVTSITVQAWGAGGGGGSSTTPGFGGARGGSGGGGGAFASTALTITSGETLTVVVGIGGKGVDNNNGGNGGSSSITGYSILGEGGKGGLLNNGSLVLGGAAGLVTNSTGTTRTSGTAGGNGESGFTDDTGAIISSGAGGNGANGGGLGGAALATAFTTNYGNPGAAPGGGGSGGRSSFFGGARRGGDGGNGKITITYNCPTYSLTNTTATAVNVCSGTSSEITLTGNLPIGLYSVSYDIQGTAQTPASMKVTTAGTGSFIATGFTTVGTRTVKITALSSGSSSVASENCSSPIITNNFADVTVNSSGTAPVALAGSNATCTQITANWQAVAGATYYELDVSTVNTFATFVVGCSALNVGNVLSHVVSGSTNTTYYYRVRAFNGSCISSNSNTITYATPLAPVTPTLAAIPITGNACTQFTVNWNAVPNATSYTIQWSTTAANFSPVLGTATNVTATNYTIAGLTSGTSYRYRIAAVNGCGTSGYLIGDATPSGSVLGAPGGLGHSNILCTQFNTSWTPVTGATSYEVQRATDAGFTTGVVSFTGITTNSFTITGLTSLGTYYYRVRAINGCGNSPYSSGGPVTMNNALPAAPTNVAYTSATLYCSEFTITWTASMGAVDYTVQRATDAGFTAGFVSVGGITGTSYTFTGLVSNTNYYYRVYARNGCGTSTAAGTPTPAFVKTNSPATAPTVSADGALTICQTDGVNLTSSLAPSGYSYLWSTGAVSQSIFVTATGSYTVQFTKTGGCNSPSSAASNVVIQGLPTATAGGSQTICSNGSATVSGASATNGTIKWTFSGGAGTLSGDTTLTPTYTPAFGGAARTVILTLTVTSNNTCAPQIATATYTVNIQAAPTVSITGSKIICANETATVLAGEVNVANGNVSWTHDGLGTLSNSTTLTPTYNSVAGDAGKQVTLTLTVTASPACTTAYTVSDIYPIAVRSENTVTAASLSPVLCVNTLMPNVTHTTTGATGIGTPSGLPSGITAAWASNTITISGTPTNAGTFNYSIPLTGGCGTYNAIGTIVVNLNTAGVASSSPTVCNHTAMTTVTHITTGATGIGTATGLPPGITASWTSNTITINGTPTNTGTFNYIIPLTGGCGSVNATGTITVNPLPITPGIGTIVQPTCVIPKGSIELNGLLTGTNWTITQSGAASQVYNTSNANFIVPDLIPGNYTFTIHEGVNCPSLATVSIEIKTPVTNVYNGTWSNGTPVATDILEFVADYNSTGDLSGCSCKVNAGKKVTFNSGHTLKVDNQVFVDSGNGASLTFENAASLVQTNNVVNTGNIIYKRNTFPIRQADYVYWSTPVNPQKIIDVSPLTKTDKLYSHNGYNWVAEAPSNFMIVGKGYIIRGPENFSNSVRSNFTASFIGVPNNGTITGEAVVGGRYFLIGNPYPSALDADDFINTNSPVLEGTLYFWTHNTPVVLGGAYEYGDDDYATYNLTGGVGTAAGSGDDAVGNNASEPSGQIGAGQSFFAKIATSGNIIFDNTMRNGGANNGQFFKPSKESKVKAIEKHRIWLNMTNSGGAFKQLLVGYIEGASNDYDKKFDGLSFDGNTYIDFYSIINDSKLTIQGRALPFDDIDLVKLGYRSAINGDFTIAISKTDENMNAQPIYLEDKTTGKIHDLRESNYTFKTAEGTFNDRFVLRYTNKSLGIDDNENTESNVLISVKNKAIEVHSSVDPLAKVYIFDVTGKLIYEKLNIGEKTLQIVNLQSSNQVLLIKTFLENESLTTSKIIF
ncbi:fibronectin type III domain-containing protein [Flavobacterium sp. LHD-80]|uniref:fibronectin type III domain-containing protein n=1 Tax=Flavobacterium sp. LHD-80 TaxID=3071411 RepID=UPI0027E1DC31|nr:fibronectin type III domain-containing protein [Flavobacterium sp. LHD-80]MDQ6471274.1 fibronectin type III domain-containing protein [Flavobacterium sp. LHD-80]